MVQPWSKSFSTSQPYLMNVVVWICLTGFPDFFIRRAVLMSIGEMIVHVIKLDDNTRNAQRGRFVRLVVLLDINKPLVSKIKISG